MLEVKQVREGEDSRAIKSLQGVTVRGATEEANRSLIVDRDAQSCIALFAIAQHLRTFDVHPFKPPFGTRERDVHA
mgnify:FL=1